MSSSQGRWSWSFQRRIRARTRQPAQTLARIPSTERALPRAELGPGVCRSKVAIALGLSADLALIPLGVERPRWLPSRWRKARRR